IRRSTSRSAAVFTATARPSGASSTRSRSSSTPRPESRRSSLSRFSASCRSARRPALATEEPLAPFLETGPEGLYCPAFEAAIDPPGPAARAIVSHAHRDHAAPGHEELWATPETIALYRRRNPEWAGRAREIRYGERLERHGVALELHPAGHVLGSAQLFFERDGRSLLFTGDFKRRPSRTAVAATAPPAEILVTETTFGLPVFRFRRAKNSKSVSSRPAAARSRKRRPRSCWRTVSENRRRSR